MGLGLVGMLQKKLAGPGKDAGHTDKGSAVGAPQTALGSAGSQGYAMPSAHLSAAGASPSAAAMAQAHAGGTYAPGMASAAVPAQMGPPAPTLGLQQFFQNFGKSGQMAADVYHPAYQPLPQAQGLPMAQNQPQQGIGLGRYFMNKLQGPGGLA